MAQMSSRYRHMCDCSCYHSGFVQYDCVPGDWTCGNMQGLVCMGDRLSMHYTGNQVTVGPQPCCGQSRGSNRSSISRKRRTYRKGGGTRGRGQNNPKGNPKK